MIDGWHGVDMSLPEAGDSTIDEGTRSQSVWASNPSYRTLRDGSLSAESPGTSCQATFIQSLRDSPLRFRSRAPGVDPYAWVLLQDLAQTPS